MPGECTAQQKAAATWKLPEQPALLIHTSTRPSRLPATLARRATLPGLLTSQGTPCTRTCTRGGEVGLSQGLQYVQHQRGGELSKI